MILTLRLLLVFFCMGLMPAGKTQPGKKAKPSAVSTIVAPVTNERQYWCDQLYKMASPVLFNLAAGTLRQNMPLEKGPNYGLNAEQVSYLEAVGRTLAGVAPWLALPDEETPEGQQRKALRQAALKGIANGVDPSNPDYLNFRTEQQPIVDAAFLAQAFLRAPAALWDPLDKLTKQRVVDELKSLRNRAPAYNNWLLFSALTEAFLLSVGEEADPARINFAVKKMNEWYIGDGWYSDGDHFAMDYYNSFVIHPMLVDLYGVLLKHKRVSQADYDLALKRLKRHAEFQERLIAADGSYPPFGRSITYRTGCFQLLAQAALLQQYPEQIGPGQIRSAMTAMLQKTYSACNNYDNKDWLVLGFCGHQPMVADSYTSTGSLYLATLAYLPLGLPATDSFWTEPATDWTQKKAWSSQPFKKDYKVNY